MVEEQKHLEGTEVNPVEHGPGGTARKSELDLKIPNN